MTNRNLTNNFNINKQWPDAVNNKAVNNVNDANKTFTDSNLFTFNNSINTSKQMQRDERMRRDAENPPIENKMIDAFVKGIKGFFGNEADGNFFDNTEKSERFSSILFGDNF